MPKFLAIHPVDPPANREAVPALAKKCKAGLSMDAYWVKSWLQLNNRGEVTKIFCEWDGKDIESVRKSLEASLPELPPSEGIFQMAEIHGEDFR
ncbi:MAG TPA: hypothetical protein VHT73_02305 [Thermodesulfobacteriota bacterium]|nr:hypothetical protein [Thermodesulfobacteriota bacterium]